MTPEETIRRALESEASTVEVRPDALAAIRARTGRRRTVVRVWFAAGLGVAAAAVAAVFAVAWPAPQPTRPAAPTVAPTASPSAGAAERLLAVYYVGPRRGDRLVREFHRTTPESDTVADRVRAAVTLMLGTAPADPDYASAWPVGTAVRGVTVAGDVVTVDLGGATPPSAIATQQLVWTVTAASGRPEVRIGAGAPVRRASAVDTLAPVWLINPQHGDVLRGGGPDIHVAGFAATAHLEIRSADGEVVHEEELALDGGSPAQREAHVTLALAPGRYTLTATVDGASDDHVLIVE
ncbi:GerMN domain-containing protein [Asanoa sp. WMMD1127]|uniref:GerMN domain-containing protein n=1 Tax=Asanoa sp. WMMD1127 TaxID=3016107 RepID=UPI0024179EAA|nr:GerMN domain-containing protein [Asanoa sp. WMMD1127]MDG4824498.1 GerMN domain-containing protein [Asanoa sp. WMMD1127]